MIVGFPGSWIWLVLGGNFHRGLCDSGSLSKCISGYACVGSLGRGSWRSLVDSLLVDDWTGKFGFSGLWLYAGEALRGWVSGELLFLGLCSWWVVWVQGIPGFSGLCM